MTDGKRSYFDNYHMHHLFYDIYSNARTGVLKVYFPDEVVKTVYFSEGNTIYASSNGEKDKLVNILIKYKKLSKEQLETALRQMNKSISLGRNLVNMGFITHKELIWAVKVQVIGIMHSIITLNEGESQFTEGPLPDGVINLPLNTMKVLFDSLLMFQDRTWIADQVHQPDSIFKKTVLFEEGKSRLITSDELLQLAESIDGEKTASQLADITTMEDFKVFKLLYALRFLNLIEERITDDQMPSPASVFEIEDEPDEDLVLAEESFAQLGAAGEQPAPEPEPAGFVFASDEDDDIQPEGELKLDEPTEKIELGSLQLDSEEENVEPEPDPDTAHGLDQSAGAELDAPEPASGEDVVVEFQLEEDELSYAEDSRSSASSPFDTVIEKPSFSEERPDDTVPINAAGPAELKFTEDDLNAEDSDESEQETHRIDRPDIGTGTGTLSESFSLSEDEDSMLMPSSSSGNKTLVVILAILAILLMAGTLYYYMFWLPQQQQAAIHGPAAAEGETTGGALQNQPDITDQMVKPGEDGTLRTEQGTPDPETVQQTENTQPSEQAADQPPAETVPETVADPQEDQPASKTATPPETRDEPAQETTTRTQANAAKTKEAPTPVDEPTATPAVSQPIQVSPRYAQIVETSRAAFETLPGGYTIQLEIACEEENLDLALRLLQPHGQAFFVPFMISGRTCYIVCSGLYSTEEDARNGMANLPEVFFEDNAPFVARTSGLLRRF